MAKDEIKLNVKEFRKLTIKQLLSRRKEAEESILTCHNGINPKFKIENHSNLRKNVARINTLIREKENE
jgi:ribosomal protein L29|tara:strand:- start:937 stop:1143 length:207 start_codon:yes stop_codon:yes gene_type:complete